MTTCQLVEGAHETRKILAGLSRTDGENIATHPGGQNRRNHGTRRRPVHLDRRRDAGRNDAHASRIGVERFDHLSGHERRVRVHPGPAP